MKETTQLKKKTKAKAAERREDGDELCVERSFKHRHRRSVSRRYRLTREKTLAQKMEGVLDMDAHDGNARTPN